MWCFCSCVSWISVDWHVEAVKIQYIYIHPWKTNEMIPNMMVLEKVAPSKYGHRPCTQAVLEGNSCSTLQGTNISPKNGILKMIFLFPRWDMLILWRVTIYVNMKVGPSRTMDE